MDRRNFLVAALGALTLSVRRRFLRDDTKHLQALVDSQAASGTVVIPAGNYNLFAPLVFPASVRLFAGGGQLGARLRWRGRTGGYLLRFPPGVAGYCICNFIFDFGTSRARIEFD